MHENDRGDVLMSLVSPDRLVAMLQTILDEDEFLSPHGLRGLSKAHEAEPFSLTVDGRDFTVGYEPGESQSALFGGNSNWRGPVWFPLNYLLIESLRISLGEIADRLGDRLVSLFEPGESGLRPASPAHPHYCADGVWHDRLLFHEYFDGDTGRGLGASHQTGWTALVAALTTKSTRPLGRRARRRDS